MTRFLFPVVVAVSFLAGLPAAAQLPVCTSAQLAWQEALRGRALVNGVLMEPERVARLLKDNTTLAEYRQLRSVIADTLDGQIELAQWCEEHNLAPQRDAHLKRALQFDPEHARVRELLGHIRVNGAWITSEQTEAWERDQAAAQRRYAEWEKPVRDILRDIASKSQSRRTRGWQRLDAIDDAESVTALEAILLDKRAEIALKTLDIINRFEEREATETLVRVAFFNPVPAVRDRAVELLSRRNQFDYVPGLLDRLVSPLTAQYNVTTDSRGNVLYQFAVGQRNMEADTVVQFELEMVQSPLSASAAGARLNARNARLRAVTAGAVIQAANAEITSTNRAIQNLLQRTTDVVPGETPESWWQWWYDENEVYVAERPVSYVYVRDQEVTATPVITNQYECLVAGTPVWTERGTVPVEQLNIGDRVLTRNPDTQMLEYQSVLRPTQRPATPTLGIALVDGETIFASGGHYFYVSGTGWTKARDLRPQTKLVTADGNTAEIREVSTGETVPLYNLVVDRNASYFVGRAKILSHDSSIPNRAGPTLRYR